MGGTLGNSGRGGGALSDAGAGDWAGTSSSGTALTTVSLTLRDLSVVLCIASFNERRRDGWKVRQRRRFCWLSRRSRVVLRCGSRAAAFIGSSAGHGFTLHVTICTGAYGGAAFGVSVGRGFTLPSECRPQDDGAEGKQEEGRDEVALRAADLRLVGCEDLLV